jgi:hypothetical protein
MQVNYLKSFIAVTCISFTNILSAQYFDWAIAAGGIGNDVGTSIATDNEGNIYVTGNISGGAYFGSQYVSGTVFEVFLAKYAPSGNLLWVKSFGGLKNEKAFSLSVTSQAVYLCGYFEGTATFGNTTLQSAGAYDVFVMKTDLNGNELWTKQAGGFSDDIAYGLTVDDEENIYVCGSYKTKMSVGNFELTTVNLFPESFMFSLDHSGNFRWAKTTYGNSNNAAFSIAFTKKSSICTVGFFAKDLQVETFSISSKTTSYDAYLIHLDKNGNLKWLRQLGSSAEEQAMAVAADQMGNIFVAGYTGGNLQNADSTLPFKGWNDVWIAKWNELGNLQWIQHAGGPMLDIATSLSIDENNHVYVAGVFENSIDFSGITLSDPDRGVFLASYTTEGNLRFAQAGGDIQTDVALGVVTRSGKAYITGYYLFKCRFGPFELPYADFFNVFIASYQIPQLSGLTKPHDSEVKIYPNPSSDYFHIIHKEPFTFEIFDAQGKCVLESPNAKEKHLVLTGSLHAGYYMLKINVSSGGVAFKKFCKE